MADVDIAGQPLVIADGGRHGNDRAVDLAARAGSVRRRTRSGRVADACERRVEAAARPSGSVCSTRGPGRRAGWARLNRQ